MSSPQTLGTAADQQSTVGGQNHPARGPSPRQARRSAVRVVRTLREAGHAALFAGGCVRDELLGHRPTDYDVVTDATPDRVAELFPRTNLVGAAFGVVLVRHGPGRMTEVATFRTDADYSDRRRPDSVVFSTPEEDAKRRDFTINAIFLDPLVPDLESGVIDHVGGRRDLTRGLVRAVGDPDRRLAEDHLRALRAVRFTCRLGFRLERRTGEAIERHARELAGVSRERVGEELRRTLAHTAAARAINLIHRLGLDGPVLETDPLGPIPLPMSRRAARHRSFIASLAAWLLDRGLDPASPSEIESAVSGARAALCLSNKERDALRGGLVCFTALRENWDGLSVAERKRAMARPGFPEGFRLVASADRARGWALMRQFEALAAIGGGIRPEPYITGEDLIGLGVRPGPGFQKWLDRLYDAQIEGQLVTREDAIRRAREMLGEQNAT